MVFFKAIATVGGFTLLSRFLGLVRDILTASFLGAGPIADVFFIALKLPNFFRRITAEGAFSVSFVPMFSRQLASDGKEHAKKFAEEAQSVMLATLAPFTFLCIMAMPWILCVVAPGIAGDEQRFDLAIEFSRITFPYILMMSLTALLGGVLNSLNRFAAFASAPMFFNLSLITALLLGEKYFETTGHALSWGVAAAGVIQFMWMIFNCWRAGYVLKFKFPQLTPRIRKLFRLMVPGVLGAGAIQFSLFIDIILASFLPIGSISYLYYADRLYQLPLGVIGIAIGTALLPMLSKALKEDKEKASKLLGHGFESALILSLPAAIGLIMIAEPAISVLFERGAFSYESTLQSSYALMAYALGLPAYVLSRVFSVAYFARENTMTPVKIAVSCAVINTLLALILISFLKHVGIALATGITAWINLALLLRGLHKRGHLDLPAHSLKRAGKVFFSGLLMALLLWSVRHFLVKDILAGDLWLQICYLVVLVGSGALLYFISLYFLGVFDKKLIKALFPKRKKQDRIEIDTFE